MLVAGVKVAVDEEVVPAAGVVVAVVVDVVVLVGVVVDVVVVVADEPLLAFDEYSRANSSNLLIVWGPLSTD